MKRIISVTIVVIISLQSIICFAESTETSVKTAKTAIESIVSLNSDDLTAGDNVNDWLAFSLGRLGQSSDAYVSSAEKLFNEERSSLNISDIERISLAVAANGGDISKNGMLEAALDGFDGDLSEKLVNQLIFTLHVLDSGLYKVPDDSSVTRKKLVDELLSRQLDNGALYMINENTSETDITAMAVTALAPYACGDKEIRASVDSMTAFLSTQQTEEGTVKNWGAPSCETTAQVLIAICTLGIDPLTDVRFIKNGKTLIDGLMSFQESDGFAHNSDSLGADPYATAQALYSLVAFVRYENGYRALFDMRAEQTSLLFSEVRSLDYDISRTDTSDTARMSELTVCFENVPVSERMYVYSYPSLINDNDSLSFSPDTLCHNTGTAVTSDIFAERTKDEQSLTVADNNVSVIESKSMESENSEHRNNSRSEVIVLLAILLAAIITLVINHTLLEKHFYNKER